MPDSYLVRFLPSGTETKVPAGKPLTHAIETLGLRFEFPCGGEGRCGRCKVRIESGTHVTSSHPSISKEESRTGLVLACQTKVQDSLVVQLLPRFYIHDTGPTVMEEINEFSNLLEKKAGLLPFDPCVKAWTLTVPSPSLQDQSSHVARLRRELKQRTGKSCHLNIPVQLLGKYSRILKESGNAIHVIGLDKGETLEIMDILPVESSYPVLLGAAVDIGTTTICVSIIDLVSGKVLSIVSGANRQILFGDDVISRIMYADNSSGLTKLQTTVISSLNELMETALNSVSSVDSPQVHMVVISGNTTMIHLLLGIDPSSIRLEPYIGVTNEYPEMKAGQLGLTLSNDQAPVVFTPSVSGYLGGDITAGILATGLHDSDDLTLYIDIGTNGETVLGNREFMVGCACSAGPAFEGGSLQHGMRATIGAIDHVNFSKGKKDIVISIMGGAKPMGICGSAMVDLLYHLFYNGIMNQKGKLNLDKSPSRIRKHDYGLEYLLWEDDKNDLISSITVSEDEIENLIRTKGAIWAGINTLLKNLSINARDIKKVIIAGNFGRSLNIRNAIGIGMFPDIPENRYHYIGNGSLLGASMILHSKKFQEQAQDIANKLTYIELSASPGYMEEFVASLFIPHTDKTLFPSFSDGS